VKQLDFEAQVYLNAVRAADSSRNNNSNTVHNYAAALAQKAGEFFAQRCRALNHERTESW